MLCKKNLKKKTEISLSVLLSVIMLSVFVSGAVLSISEANIVSNYFDFEKAWVVSIISDDYTTDSLTAYFTPQNFKDKSGTESKQSLTINVDTKPNHCTYSFKTNMFDYEKVYTIQPIHIKKFYKGDFVNEVESRCTDFSASNYKVLNYYTGSGYENNYVLGKTGLVYYEAYCVELNEQIGTIAQPIDKKIITESDWEVKAEGKTPQTATISNSESGSGRSTQLGDNVWVQWQGNLGTGEDCPDVSNLVGVHSNNFYQGWRFASRSKYQTYNSYLTNGIREDIEDYGRGYTSESLFQSRANAIMRGAIEEKEDFTFSVLDSSVYSGKIKIDLGKQIVFPLFRLIIDADYLEINIPAGKPQIVSVSDIKFTEGLSGQMTAVIKNIGEYKGGFVSRIIDCTEGFSSSTSPIGSRLDPQETETLNFNIIGSSTGLTGDIKGSCKLELKESTTEKFVTKTFSTTMTQMQECTPLSKACSVNDEGKSVIKQCNSAGTKYEIIEICPNGEECKLTSDGVKCVETNGNGNGNGGECGYWTIIPGWGEVAVLPDWDGLKIPDLFCWINYFFQKFINIFAIIVGLIAGGLGTSFVYGLNKNKDHKKIWWIYALAFIGLGMAFWYLALTFFWWIMLALVIIGLIKFIIPGI